MSEYEYEQYSADPMSSLEEGRTFPQQDSQAKRILLASSDSAHRRRSSSTIRSTAPSSSPSHELEKGELTDLRRNSATLSTLTLPNAVAATGPPPSANESSLITPASTSLVLPPPPEPVESVYEPPTPLPVRSSRRPLPALPDAPRFVPLHGLPPPPPPPSTVSRLKTGGSEELTTAEEEKRAYARASGMDDLFESRSASTSNDETGPPIPSSTATELPDYPAGGSTSLVRGQSILKRDQHDATIAENDEARANADEARQRINAESERLVELDAADSKAAARRRMEEAEEQNRQQGQQTSLDEHARARKRRDESVTLDFDIDEIDGLEDPPPPHDAVPALMPDDLLPLTDSKATWPVESEPATVSSRSVPIVPAASLLPPPPAPLAIASADPTSFPRPSLYQAQNERALASAPDFLPTTRPQVRRSTTVATLPVTHQESLFYPGAVAPLPASSHYVSPPSTSSVDTATRRGRVYRTTSVDPAAAFYTSEVGGALDPGIDLSGSQKGGNPFPNSANAVPLTRPDPIAFRSFRNDPWTTPSSSEGFRSLRARPSNSTLRSSESWPSGQASRPREQTYSSMMMTSPLPSQASVPAFSAAATLSASTRSDFFPSYGHGGALQEPTATPAFYAAVSPGGPLLPFYASSPSTSGGAVSYYTPAAGTTLPLPPGTFESAAEPAALPPTLPFDHQRSLSAPQHVQQVLGRHAIPVASRAMSTSPSIYDPMTGSQVATRRRESSFGIWSRSASAGAAQTLEPNTWAADSTSEYGGVAGQGGAAGGAGKWRRLQTIRGLFGRKGPGSVFGEAAEGRDRLRESELWEVWKGVV